jgi:glycosyltransferase involved in cell wall biosynthesis
MLLKGFSALQPHRIRKQACSLRKGRKLATMPQQNPFDRGEGTGRPRRSPPIRSSPAMSFPLPGRNPPMNGRNRFPASPRDLQGGGAVPADNEPADPPSARHRPPVLLINASDLAGPGWRFLEPHCDDPRLAWAVVSGRPRNAVERRIRRPALARWRAAAEAAWIARRTAGPRILVSHLPLMAAAGNLMRRALCPEVPHIAFAFNFTDLARGNRRRYLRWALRDIAEFVVFSRFEIPLYAAEFGIVERRIRFLPWAMEPPVPGPSNPLPEAVRQSRYLCAIGGEGRDYALLARVMAARPRQNMVVVARPYSIEGIAFPPNVVVHTNLPQPATWRIAADSCGLVIPLKTDTTACGHITMVGAQLLGLPLVVTRSRGVEDYVADGVTAQVVPAGAAAALGAATDRLVEASAEVARMAVAARAKAERENGLSAWTAYFATLADRFGA